MLNQIISFIPSLLWCIVWLWALIGAIYILHSCIEAARGSNLTVSDDEILGMIVCALPWAIISVFWFN